MNNEAKKKGANIFAEAFAESLATSIAAGAGHSWPLGVIDPPDAPTNRGEPIQFRLVVEGAIAGECFAEFYEPQVADLATKMTKLTEGGEQQKPAETLASVLSSAMEGLSQALSGKLGQLTVKAERVLGLAFGGMFVVPVSSSEDQGDLQVLLYFGVQLLDALSATQRAGETEETAVSAKNLKLVLDVELNVSLRFGQRQMPLREVLELANGSVVELDRMVDEPVELLLDGKLIARGEAVVVDGNYGLRVTEIPQPVTSHFLN